MNGRVVLSISGIAAAALLLGAVSAPALAHPTAIRPAAVSVPTPPISLIAGKTPPSGSVQWNIGKKGYLEREYRVTVVDPHEYTYTGDGTTVSVVAAPASPAGQYRSRFLLRYPSNPKKFNGRVIIEMMNTTAYEDMDIVWMEASKYLVDAGYAFVGLTVQQTGLNPLADYPRDPNRYKKLGLNLMTPAAAAAVKIFDLSGNYDPTVAWDLVSQVGKLFKTNGPTSPLHKYAVKKVYLTGQSQQSAYAVTYINAIHPLAKVYDGFLVVSTFPNPKSLNYDPDAMFHPTPAQIRVSGGGTPVLVLQTETDISANTDLLRPDASTPTDQFRLWEIPGAAHLDAYTKQQILFALNRDANAAVPFTCRWNKTTIATQFPTRYAYDAAIHALDVWASTRKAPKSAPRITTTAGAKIVRDARGNAKGGIRLPAISVPLATFGPSSAGGGFCFLVGTQSPFSKSVVKSLYPSKAAYVAKVTSAAKAVANSGYLVPFDQAQIVATAKKAKLDGSDR